MRTKTIVPILFLVLFSFFVVGQSTSLNFLSKPQADTLYCNKVTGCSGGGGNSSINESYLNANYRKIDGTNAPFGDTELSTNKVSWDSGNQYIYGDASDVYVQPIGNFIIETGGLQISDLFGSIEFLKHNAVGTVFGQSQIDISTDTNLGAVLPVKLLGDNILLDKEIFCLRNQTGCNFTGVGGGGGGNINHSDINVLKINATNVTLERIYNKIDSTQTYTGSTTLNALIKSVQSGSGDNCLYEFTVDDTHWKVCIDNSNGDRWGLATNWSGIGYYPSVEFSDVGNMYLNPYGSTGGGIIYLYGKANGDDILTVFESVSDRGGGVGGVGLGQRYKFLLENSAGARHDAGGFVYEWTDATATTETSKFSLETYQGGSLYVPLSTNEGNLEVGGNFTTRNRSINILGGGSSDPTRGKLKIQNDDSTTPMYIQQGYTGCFAGYLTFGINPTPCTFQVAIQADGDLDINGGNIFLRSQASIAEATTEALNYFQFNSDGGNTQTTLETRDQMIFKGRKSGNGNLFTYIYENRDDDKLTLSENDIVLNGNTSVNDNFHVNGLSLLSGDVSVAGDITASNIYADQNITIGGWLDLQDWYFIEMNSAYNAELVTNPFDNQNTTSFKTYDNYGQGIEFSEVGGDFTIVSTGIYQITCGFDVIATSSDETQIQILINEVVRARDTIFVHTSVDPAIMNTFWLGGLVAEDKIKCLMHDQPADGADTFTVQDGAKISITRVR